MQRSLSGSIKAAQLDALLQKELHYLDPSVQARQTKRGLKLFVADLSFSFEVLLDDVKLAHTRRGREGQARATLGKIDCCLAAAICQTAAHRILLIAATGSVIDFGAIVEQNLDELVLYTGEIRMHARCSETERRGAATINVGLRVYLRAHV